VCPSGSYGRLAHEPTADASENPALNAGTGGVCPKITILFHQTAPKPSLPQHPPFFLAEPLVVPGFKWEPRGVLQVPQSKNLLESSCLEQYDSIMSEVTFSWVDRKERENQRKHGVSFEEATTAFADENARLKHDPDHSQDEDRFILLGFSAKLRLLVVVCAYRQDDKEIRIISARKAVPKERKQYGGFL